jgi:hypothetical protein
MRRWPLLAAVLMIAMNLVSGRAPGADAPDLHTAPAVLLLIEDRGCPYCARWDRDVRQGYLNSEEGRFAPLVRRFRGSPDVAFVANVIYSPTFVVLANGREVGRIVGYQGPDFFWGDLNPLLARAGFKRATAPQ